jgi:hypothetical protein
LDTKGLLKNIKAIKDILNNMEPALLSFLLQENMKPNTIQNNGFKKKESSFEKTKNISSY